MNGPEDWGTNFNSTICQCEAQDQLSDLCKNYQRGYIYKNVRKMFTPLSKELNFNPRLSLVTCTVSF